MNRRRGGVVVQDSPLDRSYAQQAVLNPILAPCCTIFEAILIIFGTKFVMSLSRSSLIWSNNLGPDENRHVNVYVHEPVRSDAHDR